jgi:hypothetical protein
LKCRPEMPPSEAATSSYVSHVPREHECIEEYPRHNFAAEHYRVFSKIPEETRMQRSLKIQPSSL